MKNIQSIRRQYGDQPLSETDMSPDPFIQFQSWFEQALAENILDATAMVLSTVDEEGMPDSRVVLLKGFDADGLTFFTHYNSPKSLQAEKKGDVALNFHWREFARQIRIKGNIQRVSRKESKNYFSSRPRESQISTFVSKQSAVLSSRDALEKKVKEISEQYKNKDIPCPETWGGYRVIPFEFEFFQGRDNRLNDRIRYQKLNQHWKMERLYP